LEVNLKPEPRNASAYDARATRAVRTALIDLAQVLGDYLKDIVVIGGAVPWLLLPDAETPHVGTIDIDLALNPKTLQTNKRYADLVQSLENNGFERQLEGLQTFQLRKMVRVDEAELVAVTLDLLKPNKPPTTRNRPALIPNFRVVDADGAEFALQNPQIITLQGAMSDGRNNTVRLPVADLPSFLVMKGYALQKRDKPKDAYDIYYVIKNYPTGLEELAVLCQPLLKHTKARIGFEHIAGKFAYFDDFGPQTVLAFLEDTLANQERKAFLKRDAYAQVAAWLKALRLN
jgi:hypothetical protein